MQYNGHDYYYTGNVISSTILLTDETQSVAAIYVYDAYGNTTIATGQIANTNPWRYGGACPTNGVTGQAGGVAAGKVMRCQRKWSL